MNHDREFSLAPGEQERIEVALDKLEEDDHAPRELNVRVVLNVFKEYPKAVEGKTVNNRQEERALLEKIAADKAAAAEPAPAPAQPAQVPVLQTMETKVDTPAPLASPALEQAQAHNQTADATKATD
jgi:hypothetical protein